MEANKTAISGFLFGSAVKYERNNCRSVSSSIRYVDPGDPEAI